MKKYWFTSDFHLGHKNVLRFDNRPFGDIRTHDIAILSNCMSLVSPDDDFYFLGDFAFCSGKYKDEYLSMLPGNLFFIKGNHDKKDMIKLYERYGTFLGEQKTIEIDKQVIVLNHYCMLTWDRAHFGSYLLHGHSHGSLKYPYNLKWLDVSINMWDYKPVEFSHIKAIMNSPDRQNIKHHLRPD